MSRKEQAKKVGYICLILILVLVILFSGLRILESTVLYKGQVQGEQAASKTIERNGIEYFPRQDITVMLVMGIDEKGPVKDSGSYNNSGEADMVALVVFDETDQQIDIVQINRDSMVEMEELGIGGKSAGTVKQQLALSHTYGSGLEDSCESTRKTVSKLFYGLDIEYYVAMNLDAIPILNDAVGGVTVDVTEDFSGVNPDIPMGQTTLRGQQALDYVQMRKNVEDQMNTSRMSRQQKYMKAFLSAFRQSAGGSDEFLLQTYDSVADYTVTNFIAKSMSNVYSDYGDYQLGEVTSVPGELKLGKNGYYEYHLDEKALDELILRMFYEPKK